MPQSQNSLIPIYIFGKTQVLSVHSKTRKSHSDNPDSNSHLFKSPSHQSDAFNNAFYYTQKCRETGSKNPNQWYLSRSH